MTAILPPSDMATVLSSSGETLVVDWLDHRGWQSRRVEFRGGVVRVCLDGAVTDSADATVTVDPGARTVRCSVITLHDPAESGPSTGEVRAAQVDRYVEAAVTALARGYIVAAYGDVEVVMELAPATIPEGVLHALAGGAVHLPRVVWPAGPS